MKKAFILLFAVTLTSTAFSQYANGAAKFNLFGVVVGQYQFAYEHALNENSSVQLSAGIISRTWDGGIDFGGLASSFEQKNTGFIIIPEYRYYFAGEALKGVYGGVFARYRSVNIDYTSTSTGSEPDVTEISRSAIGGGILLGYQFIISDKVLIDLFLGPQFKSCLLYTSPSPRDRQKSRMPSSA